MVFRWRHWASIGAHTLPLPGPTLYETAIRIDNRDLDAIDALVEGGVRATRGDDAAWLIHAGSEANKTLLDSVYGTVAEIRRRREVAQGLAAQVTAGTSVEPKE
jgi:hypothetical protein